MSFGGFNDKRHASPMSEINVTPMVDVMLVLVVIFILTAPLLTHSIKLDLPTAQSPVAPAAAETIALSIDSSDRIFWNDERIQPTELDNRMTAAAKKQPQPELQLRADKFTRYEIIAQVLASAQTHGLTKMGFITEPKDTPAVK